MDENAEIDIEALSDEVYIPLNLLPSIVRNLNSRLAALEHEHSAADITSGTLQAARIAEGSLPGSKIEEGTVTLDRFEKSVRDSLSQSIGTARLADKCVTAAKIADGVLPARSKQNMSPMTIERYGKVRILTVLYSNTPLVANYNYNVATLPAGDRPQEFTRGIATSTGGGELILNVNTNGTVVLSTAGDAATSNANVQAISVYTVA